jgi:MFS family permease
MSQKLLLKLTLLLTSSLTVMSGATIAPSLPQMSHIFSDVPYATFLTKLILTMPALLIALLSATVGNIIDKTGRLRVIYSGLLLYAVSGVSGYFIENIYLLLVSRAFLGIAVAMVMTTTTTLIGDYFSGSERDKFMGAQGAFMALGGVIFVGLGGFLADIAWQTPFLIYGFALVVLIIAFRSLYEPNRHAEESSSAMETIISGEKTYPVAVSWVILGVAFTGMAAFYLVPIQIPFFIRNLGIESNTLSGLAIVVSTGTAAAVSSQYQKIRNRLSFARIYIFTFALSAIGFTVIGISTSYYAVLVGLFIAGIGFGAFMPNANLWMMTIAPASIRGKLVGRLTTAIFVGQFASPIIVQPIVTAFTISTPFLVAASAMALLSLIFLFSYEKLEFSTQPSTA